MLISSDTLKLFSQQLLQERRRQGLTRAQAAGICNVSESFIRDAESDPSRCSLSLMLQLLLGLGLRVNIEGWSVDETASKTTAESAP
jgi:transcriptional regulator with XRE-family HTH domain